MANIVEVTQNPEFKSVYEIGLNDDVLGGPDGIANRQAKELAERDQYLEATKVNKSGTDRLMTTAEGTKLEGIETGAQVNPGAATTATAGLMSKDDKAKLDGVAAGATANAASDATPLQNGTASAGSGTAFVREGHVHPNTCATQAVSENSTKQASTAFVHNVLYDRRPVGKVEEYLHVPSSSDLIKWRVLPLDGRVVLISDYQDLFNRYYVGDGANQSAGAWYRCNDPGNANGSRSTAGPYFKVEDVRGVSLRAAGTSSKYYRADGTPYDGMSIGAYIADGTPVISGYIGYFPEASGTSGSFYGDGALHNTIDSYPYGSVRMEGRVMDSSRQARGANEVRMATVSVYVCITY